LKVLLHLTVDLEELLSDNLNLFGDGVVSGLILSLGVIKRGLKVLELLSVLLLLVLLHLGNAGELLLLVRVGLLVLGIALSDLFLAPCDTLFHLLLHRGLEFSLLRLANLLVTLDASEVSFVPLVGTLDVLVVLGVAIAHHELSSDGIALFRS